MNQHSNENQNDTPKSVVEKRSYIEKMAVYATSSPALLTSAYKTEKLATAIFMVTDIVDLNDTLRCRIREQSMNALDHIFTALSAGYHDRIIALRQSLFALEHTRSLITIARNLGSISDMNYRILHKEIYLLETQLDRELDEHYDAKDHHQADRAPHASIDTFLSDAYRDVPNFSPSTPSASASASHTTNRTSQNDIKDISKNSKTQPTSKTTKRNSSTTSSTTSRPSHTPTSNTTPKKRPQKGESEARRQLIVDIISEKGNAMMKDIATRITNCTEKTLQRDLAHLIKNGIIEKQGKRRWSTYTVVRNG